MKKISILSIVAIAAISMASCKKDRTCVCTEGSDSQSITYNDATKRQAKANCVSTTRQVTGSTAVKTECELKK